MQLSIIAQNSPPGKDKQIFNIPELPEVPLEQGFMPGT